MSIRDLLTSEQPHVLVGKQMAQKIYQEPSETHAETVEVIKATLIRMHELEIEAINKV